MAEALTLRTPKKEQARERRERAAVAAQERAQKQARFLGAFRDSGNVRATCLAAGVARQTAYDWRETSAEFATAWDAALEDAVDILEATALQRAKASSDTLLIFLLKAHRPDKYRDTVNLRVWLEQAAGAMAAETGMPAPDIMAEFNALLTTMGGR